MACISSKIMGRKPPNLVVHLTLGGGDDPAVERHLEMIVLRVHGQGDDKIFFDHVI